jgi:putative transposase
MVTAATYHKEHYFRSRMRLRRLTSLLMEKTELFGWRLEAWAVLSNHYHWIGQAPPGSGAVELAEMIAAVHRESSAFVNEVDQTPGRKVWHNFRETSLSYQRSYLARLHYVSQNPVRHGLVTMAEDYPWCSAGWLLRNASPAFRSTLASFKIDRLKIEDDF